MADPKVTVPELLPAATLTGAELVPLWQTSGMVRATLAQVVLFSGGLIDAMVRDLSGFLLAGGTANALTVTPTRGSWDLVDGTAIAFRVANLNTASVTLNVNGKGVRSLTKGIGVALQPGDLIPGMIMEAVYLATPNEFRLRAGMINSVQTFLLTAGSGTFNTAGARRLRVRGVGGGGGSGGFAATISSEAASNGGGGSGAWFEHEINGPATSYNWTVGAGGIAGTAGGINPTNAGQDGGATLFAPCTAPGGRGGGAGPTAGSAFSGMPGAGGDIATGASIINSRGTSATHPQSGGNQQMSSIGGSTPFGASDATGRTATIAAHNGSPGPANSGAGASGGYNAPSSAAKAGQAGGSGLIIVEATY